MGAVQPQFNNPLSPPQELDVKEEMEDLFGEDEDVNMVEHESVPCLLILFYTLHGFATINRPDPLLRPPLSPPTTKIVSPLQSAGTENNWSMPKTMSPNPWLNIGWKQMSPFPTSPSLEARTPT